MKNVLKHIFSSIIILFCCGSAASVFAAENIPGTVMVMGQELLLKEQQGSVSEGLIAEYIPSGKTWDDWSLMFAVRFIPGENVDPKSSAQATADNVLKQKQAGDPVANALILDNEDGSVAVDFLVSAGQGAVYEHNVWIFRKVPKGMVSCQIARRVYPAVNPADDVKKFIADIPGVRVQMLKELSALILKFPFSVE